MKSIITQTQKFTRAIEKKLNTVQKQGYSQQQLDIMFDGKGIEYYASSKKRYEQFKYNSKVAKERPSVEKQLEKYQQKTNINAKVRVGNNIKQKKRELNNLGITDTMINNNKMFELVNTPIKDMTQKQVLQLEKELKNMGNTESFLTRKMGEEKNEFFTNRYFKKLQGEEQYTLKLEKIKEQIGNDISLYDDIIDYMGTGEFTGDFDSNQARSSGESGAIRTHDELINRLEKLESYVNKKVGT